MIDSRNFYNVSESKKVQLFSSRKTTMKAARFGVALHNILPSGETPSSHLYILTDIIRVDKENAKNSSEDCRL